MDNDNINVARVPSTPLVILTFLQQQNFKNEEFQYELEHLCQELKITPDINSNGPGSGDQVHEDGELQTDGHFCSSIRGLIQDIQPQPDLNWPGNQAEAEALRDVAAGLIEIADQLESSVVARATENLTKKLQTSSIWSWKDHLSAEVNWVLSQGLDCLLEHLPQERVVMALVLTLVKGVCEQAPRLLRGLFSTAVDYIGSS